MEDVRTEIQPSFRLQRCPLPVLIMRTRNVCHRDIHYIGRRGAHRNRAQNVKIKFCRLLRVIDSSEWVDLCAKPDAGSLRRRAPTSHFEPEADVTLEVVPQIQIVWNGRGR